MVRTVFISDGISEEIRKDLENKRRHHAKNSCLFLEYLAFLRKDLENTRRHHAKNSLLTHRESALSKKGRKGRKKNIENLS